MKRDDTLFKLYRDGFPKDSERFIRMFLKRVPNENILTHSVDGQTVSAGYIIEKTAHICGQRMPLPYLSAISTLTEYRGQGMAGHIIQTAFDTLYGRGVILTALYPFQHQYYRRYGYENASFCGMRVMDGKREFSTRRAEAADSETMSRLYAHMTHGFDGHLVYGKAEFDAMRDEFAVDGNMMMILSDKGGDFAFVAVEKGEIVRYAANSMAKLYSANLFRGLTLPDFSLNKQAYIQMRVLNVPKFLSLPLYIESDFVWTVGVSDDMLPQNSGAYRISSVSGRIGVERLNEFVSVERKYDIGALLSAVVNGSGKFRRHKFLFPDKY